MAAHCHCDEAERDAYVEEMEIKHGAPEGTVARHRKCRNCWGLIEVLH